MKGEKLGQVAAGWPAGCSKCRLVVHDCGHVCPEHVHILADGDLVFLSLILVHVESGGQAMDLVL